MVTCASLFRRRIIFKQYIFGICINFIIHLFWYVFAFIDKAAITIIIQARRLMAEENMRQIAAMVASPSALSGERDVRLRRSVEVLDVDTPDAGARSGLRARACP
jgi:hypothetical protein